jgi:phosphotransferase system enzyme I (PtsI)
MILQDQLFVNDVVELTKKERINAEWALETIVSRYLAIFEKIEDAYLKERGQDIRHIYERLIRILVKDRVSDLEGIGKRGKSLIVAHDLSPADTIQLNLNRVSGFVTEVGGRTSHTAIVARAIEIPAVVGAGGITSLVRNNDMLIIDGDEGNVIINPSEEVLRDYIARHKRYKIQQREFLKVARLKSETTDGFKVKVGANIELISELDIVKRYGAEGIGLYRTEYLYLSRNTLPTDIDHFETYKRLAQAGSLEYITIRTLDIGGDKFIPDRAAYKEQNPAMGLRAIRLCMKEMELFKLQLMGILRASAFGPLRILIPMVSGLDEIRRVKEVLAECMEELERQGIDFDREIRLGVMIEVPSACMMSDVLAPEVDFFSIGTNDLIQYTLAIDRVNEYVNYLYEPLHPAVLRLIKQTIENAHTHKIEVALCGEMAGEAMYVPILLGMELDEVSMNPYSIPKVKKIIRGISQEYCKELLDEVIKKKTAKEGEEFLRSEMASIFPEDFIRYV